MNGEQLNETKMLECRDGKATQGGQTSGSGGPTNGRCMQKGTGIQVCIFSLFFSELFQTFRPPEASTAQPAKAKWPPEEVSLGGKPQNTPPGTWAGASLFSRLDPAPLPLCVHFHEGMCSLPTSLSFIPGQFVNFKNP